MSTLPDGSDVVMLFCEIDCREGIVVAVSKGRYEVHFRSSVSPRLPATCDRLWPTALYLQTLEEGIAFVVDLYVQVCVGLVRKRGMRVRE